MSTLEKYTDSNDVIWVIWRTEFGPLVCDIWSPTIRFESANYFTQLAFFPDAKKFEKTGVNGLPCRISGRNNYNYGGKDVYTSVRLFGDQKQRKKWIKTNRPLQANYWEACDIEQEVEEELENLFNTELAPFVLDNFHELIESNHRRRERLAHEAFQHQLQMLQTQLDGEIQEMQAKYGVA